MLPRGSAAPVERGGIGAAHRRPDVVRIPRLSERVGCSESRRARTEAPTRRHDTGDSGDARVSAIRERRLRLHHRHRRRHPCSTLAARRDLGRASSSRSRRSPACRRVLGPGISCCASSRTAPSSRFSAPCSTAGSPRCRWPSSRGRSTRRPTRSTRPSSAGRAGLVTDWVIDTAAVLIGVGLLHAWRRRQ